MIEINTLDPIRSWTRRTYQFLDDKVVVKSKSITSDYDFEVQYKDIKVIQNKLVVNNGYGNLFGFYLVLIVLAINWIAEDLIIISPVFQVILQIGFVIGIFIALFFNYIEEMYGFLNQDRHALTFILVNGKNRQSVEQAIGIIREKTQLLSETHLENPMDGQESLHTFTSWDIPDFLNKSVTYFYEDRLVDVEKSQQEELVTEIKYGELSGKTQLTKQANENWGVVSSYWFGLSIMCLGTVIMFFPQTIKGNPFALFLLGGGIMIWLLFNLMKYIKQDIVYFYNRNERIIYWSWLTSRNRKQMEQIIAFIEEKTDYKKSNETA
jgi:hypothetical protein